MRGGENMTTEELKEWEVFYKQFKNGYHLTKHDISEFIRLNHLVMEATHEIHNKNMLDGLEQENVAGKPNALNLLFESLPERDKLRL